MPGSEHIVTQVIDSIIRWAVPAILVFVCGFFSSRLKDIKERQIEERKRSENVEERQRKMIETIIDGQKALLRCELVRAHSRFVRNGEPMGLGDLEFVNRTYQAYEALGGNDIGHKLYQDICECEVNAQKGGHTLMASYKDDLPYEK